MPRALLLLNPKARNGAPESGTAEKILREKGFELIPAGDCQAADYPGLTIQHRHEIDLVIVGGGDGSVKCAAHGALRAQLPLAVLPLGTANNFARSLGIPEDLEKACQVIADDHRIPVDLGLVNGELFVSVAGIGLSTHIHRTTPRHMKRRFGPVAYAFKAIRWLRKMEGFRVEIWDGKQRIRIRAMQVTVCNGRYFGGKLQIRGNATLLDQQLDLLLVQATRPLRGFLSILSNSEPGTRRISGAAFEVKTWPSMEIDVEGSVATRTPATFEVLPRAIEVFVPRAAEVARGEAA